LAVNKDIFVRVDKNGDVYLIYSDDFPRSAVGRMVTVRASNVLFDNERQMWVVYFNELGGGQTKLGEFERRDDAIRKEVELLQSLVSDGSIKKFFSEEVVEMASDTETISIKFKPTLFAKTEVEWCELLEKHIIECIGKLGMGLPFEVDSTLTGTKYKIDSSP